MESYYDDMWHPIEEGQYVKIKFQLPPSHGKAGAAKTFSVKMPGNMQFATVKRRVCETEGVIGETKILRINSDNEIDENLSPIDMDMDIGGAELALIGTKTEMKVSFYKGSTQINSIRLNMDCPIYDAFQYGGLIHLDRSFTVTDKILLQESPPGWSGLPDGRRWMEVNKEETPRSRGWAHGSKQWLSWK